MSAIVALALAAAVTLTAGIESSNLSKNEGTLMYDVEASLTRAYNDVIQDNMNAELEEESAEIIKIYDQEDNLIDSIILTENDVIEDLETKKLLNQASFLTSYSNTKIYKIN